MANVSDMKRSMSWVGLSQAWSNPRFARKPLLNLPQITTNPLRGRAGKGNLLSWLLENEAEKPFVPSGMSLGLRLNSVLEQLAQKWLAGCTPPLPCW